MGRIKDRTDIKYGRLTAKYIFDRRNDKIRWFCECSCGNTCVVIGGNLSSKHSTSCGCWPKERAFFINLTHGKAHTPEYRSWSGMKNRCYNKKTNNYFFYGGRGITVCARWLESFENFLKDMGERPSLQHSIDRINNTGNYELSNCKWSTHTEQNRNTSRNIFIINELTKEKKLISAWCVLLKGNPNLVRQRIQRGWSEQKAITTPVRRKQKRSIGCNL